MLNKYVQLLKKGEVVAFPTETVYGLGADAWNPDAVKKVFTIKGRPADNPLIVHINSKEIAADFAAEIPSAAQKLMDAFWPGALTLIFKKKAEVPDIVTAGLPTVALRWPSHPISQELISLAGPLVAPSANTSGRPSPTRATHVQADFGDDFPVIEAGETQIGLESTVLDVSESPYCMYRPGAIGKEEIEAVINEKIRESTATQGSPKSPGTKYTHYAPKASVRWLQKDENLEPKSTLYLFHSAETDHNHPFIIHYDSNFYSMAKELYDQFRQADAEGLSTIVIEPFSDSTLKKEPITKALKNRISKAIH